MSLQRNDVSRSAFKPDFRDERSDPAGTDAEGPPPGFDTPVRAIPMGMSAERPMKGLHISSGLLSTEAWGRVKTTFAADKDKVMMGSSVGIPEFR